MKSGKPTLFKITLGTSVSDIGTKFKNRLYALSDNTLILQN